jgi:hypothetical protein
MHHLLTQGDFIPVDHILPCQQLHGSGDFSSIVINSMKLIDVIHVTLFNFLIHFQPYGQSNQFDT